MKNLSVCPVCLFTQAHLKQIMSCNTSLKVLVIVSACKPVHLKNSDGPMVAAVVIHEVYDKGL